MDWSALIPPLTALLAVLIPGGIIGWRRGMREDKRDEKVDEVNVLASWRKEVAELAAMVQEHLDAAHKAQREAAKSAAAAESAERRAEKSEMIAIGLVEYIRTFANGVKDGTVPPHPPISRELAAYLKDEDFPWWSPLEPED